MSTNKSPSVIAEKICTTGYLLGEISGLNRAAQLLEDHAAEAFKARNDDLAKRLRDLSDITREEARNRRTIWDKEHRPTEDHLFRILEQYDEETNWADVQLSAEEEK